MALARRRGNVLWALRCDGRCYDDPIPSVTQSVWRVRYELARAARGLFPVPISARRSSGRSYD